MKTCGRRCIVPGESVQSTIVPEAQMKLDDDVHEEIKEVEVSKEEVRELEPIEKHNNDINIWMSVWWCLDLRARIDAVVCVYV